MEDWKLLKMRYEQNLSLNECLLFQDTPSVYTTRADVNHVNLAELQSLNESCARVVARHDGGQAASKVSADDTEGLDKQTFLAKCAKIMITHNI